MTKVIKIEYHYEYDPEFACYALYRIEETPSRVVRRFVGRYTAERLAEEFGIYVQ